MQKDGLLNAKKRMTINLCYNMDKISCKICLKGKFLYMTNSIKKNSTVDDGARTCL